MPLPPPGAGGLSCNPTLERGVRRGGGSRQTAAASRGDTPPPGGLPAKDAGRTPDVPRHFGSLVGGGYAKSRFCMASPPPDWSSPGRGHSSRTRCPEMDVYRLYFLDPRSGRIRGFHEFEAEHDAAAIEKAERMRVDDPMELWCRARKVEQ